MQSIPYMWLYIPVCMLSPNLVVYKIFEYIGGKKVPDKLSIVSMCNMKVEISGILLTVIIAAFTEVQADYPPFQNNRELNNQYSVVVPENTSICPPWFTYNNSSGECVCGDELNGIVSCDNEGKKVYILQCYCMTHDEKLGTIVGHCFTNCFVKKSKRKFVIYNKVPHILNQLNEVICGERWNRKGRLCGQCEDGYYPLAYSYNMSCVNCTHADARNWLKYISSAFLPLTVFFFFVLGFGISASSPQLEAFIIFAQITTTPANIRMILEVLDADENSNSYISVFGRLIIALYGVWNLDFFRTLLPQNCLKISTLQVLALDYIIAVYPLALIIVTYLVIDLYDRRFFLLVWLVKPFKSCLKSVDDSMNIKSSILNTFVTFILLSYGKFLTVSFDLLVSNKVYSSDGKSVGTVLFYDGTIDYFGHQHLPYGVLAIIITLFFNIVPLLFTLIHPLKCCKGHLGKWPALRICLDSFQGCYKDGTEGTRDCRFFSSLYLIIRISLFVVYGVVKDGTFYPIAAAFLLLLTALIFVFQPFKTKFKVYNTIHALLILILALWCVVVTCMDTEPIRTSFITKFSLALSAVIPTLPSFYIVFLLLKWLYSKRDFQYCFVKHCKFCRIQKTKTGMDDSKAQESYADESLPHRLQNVSEELPFHTTHHPTASQYGSTQQREISAY